MSVLYVLTTSGNDVYLDLTYISILFLLSTNPKSKVYIACDTSSYDAIKTSKHPISKLGFELISVDTPEGAPALKNRYVKCRMRRFMKGDFLYLDSDTLVRSSLEEIFSISSSLAVSSNHNVIFPDNFDEREQQMFVSNEWRMPDHHYYNAGVIFWRDTTGAQQLSDLYIEKWHQSSKNGQYYDQPAFNSAITDWGCPVFEMDQKFNAQFINDYRLSFDAVIWHRYYSGGTKYPMDYFQLLLDSLAQGESISDDLIAKVLSAKCVLVSRNSKNERSLVKLINRKNGVVSKVDYYRHQTPFLKRVLDKL